MKNRDVKRVFEEIADLLELGDGNPFRIRAYRRAAMIVEGLPEDVAGMREEDLCRIPGVGKDLAGKIRELCDRGRIGLREELSRQFPEGILAILRVPGIGPKTARLLLDRQGIKSLDELEAAAQRGTLAELPGIREKTVRNILKGIAQLRKGTDRIPLGEALPAARRIREILLRATPKGRVELAGSLRRWKETIGDLDLLATSRNPDAVMASFVGMPFVKEVLERGGTKAAVLTEDGLHVDLRVVAEEEFGAALQYFTGSKAHNVRLREMASRKGLKVNEYGIFRERDGKRLGGKAEEDIYRILGLPFIPPELREDRGEIEAALAGKLPDLLTPESIRGDLHVHTDWSDGGEDLETVARAAKERGYGYVAVTDHSKGLGVARGLSAERVREQIACVDRLNRKLSRFRILKGIEVDIRGDGSLDLPDGLLADLDLVVASIHSGFRQGREQLTKRLLAAVRNPYVSVIAHPTGRLLGEREPYDVDLEALVREAAERVTALEINANPMRLDLDDVWSRRAATAGIPLAIGTDAHRTTQYEFMPYGVSIARRAWLTGSEVLNASEAGALLRRLRAMRTAKQRAAAAT